MRSFLTILTILILPLLISTQSLATVCTAKCSFENLLPEEVVEKVSEHKGCHQTSSEEEESSDQEKDCGSKLCQLDEIIKSDVLEITAKISLEVTFDQNSFCNLNLKTKIFNKISISKSPPGFRPYLTVAIFIQKSSYLI